MDSASAATSSEKIDTAQASNGIKDTVCLVDIPMPSADESQNDKTTSKEGVTISYAAELGETRVNSADKVQSDLHRQFNLISVPPPPPPSDFKSILVSNTVISTQRTVNFFCSI